LDEVQATIGRINQDNNRLRAEHDELLAAFNRIAPLVEYVRLLRSGGAVGLGVRRTASGPSGRAKSIGAHLRELEAGTKIKATYVERERREVRHVAPGHRGSAAGSTR